MYRVAIITLSDTASKGERIDESGRVIAEIVRNEGYEVVFQKIIPDEGAMLEALLCGLADNNEADLILTTGGTGFSKRDNTPEATKRVIERETPGISEAMRYCSLQVTPRNVIQRSVRNPQRRVDRQSAWKSQGSERMSGVCDWSAGPRS